MDYLEYNKRRFVFLQVIDLYKLDSRIRKKLIILDILRRGFSSPLI